MMVKNKKQVSGMILCAVCVVIIGCFAYLGTQKEQKQEKKDYSLVPYEESIEKVAREVQYTPILGDNSNRDTTEIRRLN